MKVIGLRYAEFHHGGEVWRVTPGARLDIGVIAAALRAISEGYVEADEPSEERPTVISAAPSKPLETRRTYTKRHR